MAARPMIEVVPVPLKLNLGCSDAHLKGWTNVDLCAPADQIADLSKPWPWNDSSVDAIKAWDVFEHCPSKLLTMNEVVPVPLKLNLGCSDAHLKGWTNEDLCAPADQ